jgi:hypothetical protein
VRFYLTGFVRLFIRALRWDFPVDCGIQCGGAISPSRRRVPPRDSLIFCFPEKMLDADPKQRYIAFVLSHSEGRIAIATDAGTGCGGRGSVGRERHRRADFP